MKAKQKIWQSIHYDYLIFAINSLNECKNNNQRKFTDSLINKSAIETIRYSYDCIEATTEFIYSMGRDNQLRLKVKESWLTNYLNRNWNNFSLSDKIGILSYAWTNSNFWISDTNFQLFKDLKKVRDGLTHPIPYGTERESEILTEELLSNGTIYTRSKTIDEKELKPNWLSCPNKSIAKFNTNPSKLSYVDAEKALEILLLHLQRIEKLFFKGSSTWFYYYNQTNNKSQSIDDLLNKIKRKFIKIWTTDLN